MNSYPKYIKCKTIPDENGLSHEEWVVRLWDETMDDKFNKKIPTPANLLNRYYSLRIPSSKFNSIFKSRNNKKQLFMTYEEIANFKCSSNIEVK
jgi:hypothetical protein